MYPYLEIFGRQIPMYGLMAALGLCLAVLYFLLCEKKRPVPAADAELALVYCLVGTFLGAKLLYLLTVLPEFLAELPYLFSETEAFLRKYLYGGLVFYGGLYGALTAAWLYCRANRLPFYDLCRSLLPLLPLIHGFGRIGCFCTGCCYGVESVNFGIAFTASLAAPNGVKLLPVQLYEAAFEFLLFFVLARLSRREGSGKNMLCLWLLAYGVFRFVLEFFRGDELRGFLGVLSTSQALSIVTVAFGLLLALRRPLAKSAQM